MVITKKHAFELFRKFDNNKTLKFITVVGISLAASMAYFENPFFHAVITLTVAYFTANNLTGRVLR